MPAKDPPWPALFTDTLDQINGVGNTYRRLIEYCRKTDKRLDIYTYSDRGTYEECLDTVRVLRFRPLLPVYVYPGLPFDLPVIQPGIIGRCRRTRYALIHVATPGSMGLNGLLSAKLLGIPLIGSYHTELPGYIGLRVGKATGSEALMKIAERVSWSLMKCFYNRCRVVLAPSEYTKGSLKRRLKTEVGIFFRGIDTERFSPRHRQASNGVTALYVGRLAVEKNLGLLVETFQGREDVRLMVVGDGPSRGELEGRLKGAAFTGFLTGTPLSRAFASADLFVFPSETETFGQVVLEAMASGLPVVVKDSGGQRELVKDGKDGFVARDDGEFKQKVHALIDNPALRKAMGYNARHSAIKRSWDDVFSRLFEVYEEHAHARPVHGRDER
jgi:glycosyltransferase involved in cell wall biosynthesis